MHICREMLSGFGFRGCGLKHKLDHFRPRLYVLPERLKPKKPMPQQVLASLQRPLSETAVRQCSSQAESVPVRFGHKPKLWPRNSATRLDASFLACLFCVTNAPLEQQGPRIIAMHLFTTRARLNPFTSYPPKLTQLLTFVNSLAPSLLHREPRLRVCKV